MATAKKPAQAPAKSDTNAPAEKASGADTYSSRAAALGAAVRDTVEELRSQVNDVVGQVDDLQQNNEPEPVEIPVADGVRRIPMAAGEVLRALDGLNAAAADLQRTAG